MPIGGFLEEFPSLLFISAHLVFLGVAVWVVKRTTASGARYASAFWLYAASQVLFLSFFGGVLTMKMTVLLEQTLIVIMALWIAISPKAAAS